MKVGGPLSSLRILCVCVFNLIHPQILNSYCGPDVAVGQGFLAGAVLAPGVHLALLDTSGVATWQEWEGECYWRLLGGGQGPCSALRGADMAPQRK